MTAAQTFVRNDLNDRERMLFLSGHAQGLGTVDGQQTWVMPEDGSRVHRVAAMGTACYGSAPPDPNYVPHLRESEPETVQGQHGRDAQIVKVEGPRTRRFKLRCREAGTSIDSITCLDTRHTAWFVSYLRAYDAAEAWAWRGEVPEGDC